MSNGNGMPVLLQIKIIILCQLSKFFAVKMSLLLDDQPAINGSCHGFCGIFYQDALGRGSGSGINIRLFAFV